jgi:hypothetical protein
VTAPQPEDTPPLSPSLTEDQFPVAIPLLEARNRSDDVEVITLHTGGNDVFGPIIGACREGFNLTCAERIQTELNNYERDLSGALSTLRAAAGGDTRIIIGTYDNPFRFTVCAPLAGIPGVSTLGELVLEGAPTLGFPSGLHDIMRTVAGTPGMNVNVANVHGRLGPLDWLSTTIPTDCLHPDDSGYDEVTEVFLEVLGLDPAG